MISKIVLLAAIGFSLTSYGKQAYSIGECISSVTSYGTVYIEKIVSVNKIKNKYTTRIYSNGKWESRLRETSFKYAHNPKEYNKASCP